MYGGTHPEISNSTLSELTLDKIDFDWIKKQTKIKFLKKAIKLIEEDGRASQFRLCPFPQLYAWQRQKLG